MRLGHRLLLPAFALVLHCSSAWSLGLGDARVQSFIGQPLELRIDLLTSPTDNLDSVTARLASAEDFALIGASRESIGVPLYFSVHEGEGGADSYILVTSRLALADPVIRLVIEVNWASGRLLREYTVFLDPPTVPSQAPAPSAAASAARSQPSGTTSAPSPVMQTPAVEPPQEVAEADAPREVAQPPLPEPADTSAQDAGLEGDVYGPVRNGETLWRVASNYVGQSNLDMNQVMLAIQRKNPEAFIKDNINLLKRGATLEMPSSAEVEEIGRQRARELVAQQEAAFLMRSSLPGSSTPLIAAETNQNAVEPSAPAVDAETESDESIARLEIVPASEDDAAAEPGTGAVPGGEGSDEVQRDLREELARTEEELISERQQNEYLRERISELEEQISDTGDESAGLVADRDFADLEDRLEAERLEEAQEAQSLEIAAEDDSASNVPSVTTSAASDDGGSWYSGPMIWFIMVIIVIAAVVGWVFNRRRGQEYDLAAMSTPGAEVGGLKGEAEEILRTLDADPDDHQGRGESDQEAMVEIDMGEDDRAPWDRESDDDSGEAKDVDEQPVKAADLSRRRAREVENARVLDEESSDPEIKLDLARAYISMGDKEAARVILDEVLNTGSEKQVAEAQAMLDEL